MNMLTPNKLPFSHFKHEITLIGLISIAFLLRVSSFSLPFFWDEISDFVNNKKAVLAVLGEKQIFGEMGLIEDQPRSATATAVEDVQLAVLNRDSFNELFEKKPKVLLPIIKALFERLRTANKTLISKDILGQETVEHKEFEHEKIIILSGTNGASRDALDGGEIEIDKFPFKVGRDQ